MTNTIKLNRASLETFISKYHLGGNIESVVWKMDGKQLTTDFVSDARTLLGHVSMSDFKSDETVLGIFTTSKLVKLLSVLEDEIELNIVKSGTDAKSMGFSSKGISAGFNLSSLDVIPSPPKKKDLPVFGTKIKLTKEFIDKFIKSCAALPEVTTFYVTVTKTNASVTIGYTSVPSNNINIPVEVETFSPINNLTFNTSLYKEVFSANKDAETSILELSEKGLSKLEFKKGDFKSVYYIVSVEEAR